ncbi:hypothetical protein [Nonomuraea longispora]|uniref:hypothetical protein n=1 Tax=Nonomuraea longispora TaxID=1848320 RepID=UPI0014044A47|nr:hypothetical protein [Nonomuraea longispora]
MLAKYGYIERVPGQTGRDRPWQLVDIEQSWNSEQPDEESRSAASTLSHAFLDREHSRMKAATLAEVPEAWRGKLPNVGATLWLTPEEAEHLGQAITQLISPYVDRWREPDARPVEGRPVRLFHNTYLLPYADRRRLSRRSADRTRHEACLPVGRGP